MGSAPWRRLNQRTNSPSSAISSTSEPTKSTPLTRHQENVPTRAAAQAPTAGKYHHGVGGKWKAGAAAARSTARSLAEGGILSILESLRSTFHTGKYQDRAMGS